MNNFFSRGDPGWCVNVLDAVASPQPLVDAIVARGQVKSTARFLHNVIARDATVGVGLAGR